MIVVVRLQMTKSKFTSQKYTRKFALLKSMIKIT